MIRAMAQADSVICKALHSVLERLTVAGKTRVQELQHISPRLVAASKTKPVSMIVEAYSCGQRHFGENYAQELEEKGKNSEILSKCDEIKWHYIGHLQKNKVNKVLTVPNIWMIETIHNMKIATNVNNCWERLCTGEKLRVLVQVNTSREPQKHGCMPETAKDVVTHVMEQCPQLEFCGLMTIGAFDHDLSKGPNPDFSTLIKCKEDVCRDLKLDPQQVELSMGMSNDFEHAVQVGSYNVRVGSTIFGAREYQKKSAAETESAKSNAAESNPSTSKTHEQSETSANLNQVEKSFNDLSTKES